MNEISEWLEVNAERLAEIASETELDATVVHLIAVLVVAGLADDQIYEQLSGLVISLDGKGRLLAGAPRALGEIRRIATTK